MVVCFLCVCTCACIRTHNCGSQDNLHLMGSWDHTLTVGLGIKLLYPLSHLTGLVYFKLFLYYWGSNPGPCELLGLQVYAIKSRLPSFLN